MSVTSNYSSSSDTLTIKLTGHFDFGIHQEFRQSYASLPASNRRTFIIDMLKVDHMDSAALGMLLVLREKSGADKTRIILQGAKPDVLRILEISGFRQLFTIA
jgi:anti-anti-sigma factor